eukprot:Opistho-2@26021
MAPPHNLGRLFRVLYGLILASALWVVVYLAFLDADDIAGARLKTFSRTGNAALSAHNEIAIVGRRVDRGERDNILNIDYAASHDDTHSASTAAEENPAVGDHGNVLQHGTATAEHRNSFTEVDSENDPPSQSSAAAATSTAPPPTAPPPTAPNFTAAAVSASVAMPRPVVAVTTGSGVASGAGGHDQRAMGAGSLNGTQSGQSGRESADLTTNVTSDTVTVARLAARSGTAARDAATRDTKATHTHHSRSASALPGTSPWRPQKDASAPLLFSIDAPAVPRGGVEWDETLLVYTHVFGDDNTVFVMVQGPLAIAAVKECGFVADTDSPSVSDAHARDAFHPLPIVQFVLSRVYAPRSQYVGAVQCRAAPETHPSFSAALRYTLKLANGTVLPTTAQRRVFSRRTPSLHRLHDVCAVTQVKNRAVDLPDWLMYHRRIGVEHFVVLDNNSSDSLRAMDLGADVEVVSWPWRRSQPSGVFYMRRLAIERCRWVAFFDSDEYIFPIVAPHLHNILHAVETHNSSVGALHLRSKLMGSDGHVRRPTIPPPLAYTHHGPDPWEPMPKTILRPDVSADELAVHDLKARRPYDTRAVPDSSIFMMHYKVKSWQDYMRKYESRATSLDWKLPKEFTVDNPTPLWRKLDSLYSVVSFTQFRDFYLNVTSTVA